MSKNIEIKSNFTTIFARYDSVEDLKAIANSICAQVKEAFEARVAEINSGNTGVIVEVTDSTKTTKPKVKVSKAAAAKEVAAKMKRETSAKAVPATTATSESNDEPLIALTDTAAIKKLGLTFEKYNDRCWVLRGDTKPLRKVLKEKFRGVFNSRLTGGEGWVFKTATAQSVGDALGLKVKVA